MNASASSSVSVKQGTYTDVIRMVCDVVGIGFDLQICDDVRQRLHDLAILMADCDDKIDGARSASERLEFYGAVSGSLDSNASHSPMPRITDFYNQHHDPESVRRVLFNLFQIGERMRVANSAEYIRLSCDEGMQTADLIALETRWKDSPAQTLRHLAAAGNMLDKIVDAPWDYKEGRLAFSPTAGFYTQAFGKFFNQEWQAFRLLRKKTSYFLAHLQVMKYLPGLLYKRIKSTHIPSDIPPVTDETARGSL